jgi:hypothetical protein
MHIVIRLPHVQPERHRLRAHLLRRGLSKRGSKSA